MRAGQRMPTQKPVVEMLAYDQLGKITFQYKMYFPPKS
jgi:hypothetical protein